jgi:hypothetical protein
VWYFGGLDVGELLTRERRDLGRGVVRGADQPGDPLQDLAAGVGVLAALGRLLPGHRGGDDDLVHLGPGAGHGLSDLRCLRRSLRGELADLIGDDGKAATVLAGARSRTRTPMSSARARRARERRLD